METEILAAGLDTNADESVVVGAGLYCVAY